MYRHVFKRLIDLLLSTLGIVILALPMLIIAIIIRIDSPGPAIFKQKRVGKGGKVYTMYKFRSMCVGAEQQEGGVFCTKGDKRVTKFGNFIRKTSIDELPQLFNIFVGHMSIIGPRPVLTYYPYNWEEYTEEQLVRFNVRPGVTGWAAVHGRKTNTVEARFAYDNYYVEHLSLWLDIKIFFMTVKAVFTNEGNEDNGAAEVKREDASVASIPTEGNKETVGAAEEG